MGGTCCITRDNFDDCIEYFFEKLPISRTSTKNILNDLMKLSIEEAFSKHFESKTDNAQILEDFNKVWGINTQVRDYSFIRTLPQTNFQSFIYKYLVVEAYDVESINFFIDVYKEINHSIRYPVIKFIMLLLSSQSNTSPRMIAESLSYYSIYKTRMIDASTDMVLKSIRYIDSDDLRVLLKYYIQTLTAFSINSLMKPLMKELYDHKMKSHYLNFWNDKGIEGFIKKTFFTSDDLTEPNRKIDQFIKSYYNLLISPSELRKMYTDYLINEEVDKEVHRRISVSLRKFR